MASFVVETYVPVDAQGRFAAEADDFRVATDTAVAAAGHVRHVRSFLAPGDAMGFHVVEADTSEDVARVTALAGIEVERIVEVVGLPPAVSDVPGEPTAAPSGGPSDD